LECPKKVVRLAMTQGSARITPEKAMMIMTVPM
jgi:hypothetical protein